MLSITGYLAEMILISIVMIVILEDGLGELYIVAAETNEFGAIIFRNTAAFMV